MVVECAACGNFHDFKYAGMLLIIEAFQAGDMGVMTSRGIVSACLLTAFTEERMASVSRRFPKYEFMRNPEPITRSPARE